MRSSACRVPDHDPVHKVTIIPRGRALGVTMFLPEQDRYSHSKSSLESRLASLYGGRVAEELIFGDDKVTTGASNDIQRATQLARNMVTKYGLSEELGPMTYRDEEDEVFLGRSVTQHKHVSEETARKIDEVVRGVIDRAYERAREILVANMDKLEAMAGALLQYETIDREQIAAIMAGNVPNPPKDWTDDSKPAGQWGWSGQTARGKPDRRTGGAVSRGWLNATIDRDMRSAFEKKAAARRSFHFRAGRMVRSSCMLRRVPRPARRE